MKLGNVGDDDPNVTDALGGALQDSDAQVRRDAVFAVVKLKRPGETIMTRLRIMIEIDPDPRARDLATKAVVRLNTGRGSTEYRPLIDEEILAAGVKFRVQGLDRPTIRSGRASAVARGHASTNVAPSTRIRASPFDPETIPTGRPSIS